MKKILAAVMLSAAAGAAFPQTPAAPANGAALCSSCGTVQSVRQETRKGKGGAAGIVGGAVVGGLLGNQIGKGTGRTVATVGGAAAGGYVGNEVQKQVTSKKVWVTRVRMKDGSIRTFEQQAQPTWAAGSVVKATGQTLRKV